MVNYKEAEAIRENWRLWLLFETSAKTGFNITKLFCEAAKFLYEETKKRREVNEVRKIK